MSWQVSPCCRLKISTGAFTFLPITPPPVRGDKRQVGREVEVTEEVRRSTQKAKLKEAELEACHGRRGRNMEAEI